MKIPNCPQTESCSPWSVHARRVKKQQEVTFLSRGPFPEICFGPFPPSFFTVEVVDESRLSFSLQLPVLPPLLATSPVTIFVEAARKKRCTVHM